MPIQHSDMISFWPPPPSFAIAGGGRRATAELGAADGDSGFALGFPLPRSRDGSAPRFGVPKTSWIVRTEEGMEVANVNEKPLPFVTSLPVVNVQSLAASTNLSHIPERYVRPEIDNYPLQDGDCEDEVPVVDMHKLFNLQHSLGEAAKLVHACEEWGFFQLINHGVSVEVIEEMKRDIEEFFQLPLEEKKPFAKQPGTIEGYGQHFVVSEDQKLDWGDMFFLFTQPATFRNTGLWPTQPHTFRDTLDRYSLELKRVTGCLLEVIGRDLGLVPEKFIDMFKDGIQAVRMNYYPPCPHANKVLGLSPHSDAVGLTLLLQVNEVQGLQIKRNGEWIGVKPLPGALIVNIGDILEIMSNGKYKSIEHRAIINTEKERLSVAAFHSPSYGSVIGPIRELVEGNMGHYKTVSYESYIKLINSRKLDGKSCLDQMKL